MSEIIRHDVNEGWAHSGMIEAGDFVFVGYCVGNIGKVFIDMVQGGKMDNRPIKPYKHVKVMLGDASTAWEKLVGHIRYYYEIDEIWAEGKPTHKHYNLLFFKRSGKALITLCLREGYFLVSITFGSKERAEFEKQREIFCEAICQEYDVTETLHDGKWLGFEVRDDSIIEDIINLIHIKRKPNRKSLPDSIEKCGQLDIGLSHEEITELVTSNEQ